MLKSIFFFNILKIISFFVFFNKIQSFNIFNHWTCVGYQNNHIDYLPYTFNIGELPIVAWKKNGKYFSTINICKHMGSRLDNAHITNNGCLKCPYHGFEYLPDSNDCFGQITPFQGKLFWSYNSTETTPYEIPFYCDDNYEKSEVVVDMDCSLQDSAYNSMDLRHPEYVHNNFFGFGSTTPASNIVTKFTKNGVDLEFEYYSKSFETRNQLFTKNVHSFKYPSSTWSMVKFSENKNLVVGVYFHPLQKNKTRWYVTFLHNYKKSNFGKELVKIMGKTILLQDSLQMKNQYPENKLKNALFLKHSFSDEDVIVNMRKYFKKYQYPDVNFCSNFVQKHFNKI